MNTSSLHPENRPRAGVSAFRAAFAAFLIAAAGAFTVSVPHSAFAAPAAGTVIGNQASATYNDAGGTPRNATSNLVQTTITQVKSFTLTSTPQARTAAAGQTVYYPHTITNTGNGTDTYALTGPAAGAGFVHTSLVYYVDADGNGVPDNFTPITTSGPIAAAGIFRFVAAGTVPGGAVAGQTGEIIVSATDTTPTTLTNSDTTTVANSAISVTKSLSLTSGPSPNAGPITVTLSYANSGSGSATSLLLRDTLPAGFTYIPGSGRWSVSGVTALTDAAGGDPVGIAYEFTTGQVIATIATVPAGFSGTVTFQVSVSAGLAPGFVNNTAQFQTTTQAQTNTNTASYQVVRVGGVTANGSITDSTDLAGENVIIASAPAGSTITFDNVIWNTGNAPDSFVISLAGQAGWPAGTTFTLLQSDGATSLIANTTPPVPVYGAGCPAGFVTDGTPPTQYCGYVVKLRVQLPVTATAAGPPAAPFQVTKTATSAFDNTKSNPVIDQLTTITANSVDLTNNSALPGIPGQGQGATGTTVITTNTVTPSTAAATITRFRLYANNTGSISDSFNLAVAGTPAGWSVAFRADASGLPADCSTVGAILANTGTINAGAARLVCAEVTVPVTASGQAAPGTYNLDFSATSALNGAVSDVKRDAVTVNAVQGVTLTPNNIQQTFPGASVTYTHVLTNLGNVAYAVPANPITFAAGFLTDSRAGSGWTSIAYVDGNGNGVFDPGVDDVPANQITTTTQLALGVNATRTIFVRVFAPGSALASDPANISTLTATYGGSSATATDTTSVTNGLVVAKEQVAVSCAAAGPHAGYSAGPIASGPSTAPGQCIAYRITASNAAAVNITNVLVSDNIPANTRQRNSCGAPSTSLGTIVSPGDGNAGTITATYNTGPLAPGQAVVVTFCARIDP